MVIDFSASGRLLEICPESQSLEEIFQDNVLMYG